MDLLQALLARSILGDSSGGDTPSGGGTDLSMVGIYVADYLDSTSATVTTGVLDRYRRQIYGYGSNAP